MSMRASPARPIEIIGGGLAGLALGAALRREAVPVQLFERGEYPRHRMCGEFIAGLDATTRETLQLSPILADALHHPNVAWLHRERLVHLQPLPTPALGISRYTLDARLARTFVALGGELHTGKRIQASSPTPGRVFATGRRTVPRSAWIGLKLHVRDLIVDHALEVHLGRDCYFGLTPVADNIVNCCGLFRRRPLQLGGPELLFAYLRAGGLGRLADRLAAAGPEAASFCAVAGVAFHHRVPTLDTIRLGDASAMIPPFTGNGMAIAFQSAAAALPPLLAYARGEMDWPAACHATDAALRGRFRVRLASARLLHPFLHRPSGQRLIVALARARILPFGSLYAALH